MKKRRSNTFKIAAKNCRHAYIHNDLKKTLDKLQRFYQKKENLKNPKHPNTVTGTWTSKKLNSIISGMLKREIK